MDSRSEVEIIELPALSYFPGPDRAIWSRSPARAVVENTTAPVPVTVSEPADEDKPKRVEYISLAALMWAMFVEGWHDGSAGKEFIVRLF